MNSFTARRKLLRGSLSAPLVLTVASPSAFARDTFLACIARGEGLEGQPFTDEQTADRLVRKEVPVVAFKPTDEDAPNEYEGKRFERRDAGYVDIANGTVVDGIPDGYQEVEAGKAYKLVYFGSDGSVTGSGFLTESGGGSPVTLSCWFSFTGN